VPRLLTIDQKQQRVGDSEQCSAIFNRNKDEFFHLYITIDETWLLHYTPKSNRQSAEWTERNEPNPKREKTQRSAGKVMASVFWDARGIMFIDYLEKAYTINNEYYIALLKRLNDEIKKKSPHLKKEKVLFHHKCCVTNQSKRRQNCMNQATNCFNTITKIEFTYSTMFLLHFDTLSQPFD
jgi:hypothetical protein